MRREFLFFYLPNNVPIVREQRQDRQNERLVHEDFVRLHKEFDAFQQISVQNRMVFEIVEIYFPVE